MLNSTPNYFSVKNPLLFEINTRVWLKQLQTKYAKHLTIATVPVSEWEKIKDLGFQYVWLMGVWFPSMSSREIAKEHFGLQQAYTRVNPAWKSEEIVASPYAIADYTLSPNLGSQEELEIVHNQLNDLNMGLILDFVPNHTAIDHPWVFENPEYYVLGNAEDYDRFPEQFFKITANNNLDYYVAHGKDPWFDSWTDTAQLNYFNSDTRIALLNTLRNIAKYCDGIRSDMSMLVLNDIHKNTWSHLSSRKSVKLPEHEFWEETLPKIKEIYPNFKFIAEVYWDLEQKLHSIGFDYSYDKGLYDLLCSQAAPEILTYLKNIHQRNFPCLRFTENHDEERSLAVFKEKYQAAALVSFFMPGMKLLYAGQLTGELVKLPLQMQTILHENINHEAQEFYQLILNILSSQIIFEGEFSFLNCDPAWEGNLTCNNFIAYCYNYNGKIKLILVNYSNITSQARVRIPAIEIQGNTISFYDELHTQVYERAAGEIYNQGLYVELKPYGAHILNLLNTDIDFEHKQREQNIEVVAAVITNAKGEILICQRPANKQMGGLWEFPGGKVEKGESHTQALTRELAEELCVKIEVGSLIDSIEQQYHFARVKLYSYYAKIIEGNLTRLEHSDMRFVSKENLSSFEFTAANYPTIAWLNKT